MKELKHLFPEIVRIVTTVEIPVRREVTIYADSDIQRWIQELKKAIESAEYYEYKYDAEMCLGVLEWAESCNATVETAFNDKGKNGNLIVFEFKFTDIINLNTFETKLKAKVAERLKF